MSAIARLYTFVAGTKAKASEVNGELNAILAKINGDLVHRDGMNAFTAVQSGILPTAAGHLATKAYVDSMSGSGGGASFVKKTADQAFTTVAGQNDTHLKFAALASTTYLVRALLLASVASSTAVITGSLFGPTGATWVGRILTPAGGTGASGFIEALSTSQFTETTAGQWYAATALKLYNFEALVTVSTTAGDVGLKQIVTTGGQTLTVKANSTLTYQAL